MVDGRTTTGKIVNQLKQQPPRDHGENRTPIATDMYLPNLSGVATHPEAIHTFGRLTANNTWTGQNTWTGNNTFAPNTTTTMANVGINDVFNMVGGSIFAMDPGSSAFIEGATIDIDSAVIDIDASSTFDMNGTGTIRGTLTFDSDALEIRNPAGTFEYKITGAAIAADRILNLPLITATDTLASLGLAQTFTATKTFNAGTSAVWDMVQDGTSTASSLLWTQFKDGGVELGRVSEITGAFGFSGVSSCFMGLTAGTDYILTTSGTINYVTTGTHTFTGKIYGNGEIEIDGALNHDGTTIGFYGVAPTTRPTAYTQTYSTATRTHAAVTSLAAVDTNGAFGFALAADRTAIITAINAIRTDLENLKQLVNSIIDDRQADGLAQ